MTIAQQLIGVASVFRIDGNAGRYLDAMLARAREKRPVEGLDDTLGKLADRIRQRRARHRDGEFVAAQARNQAVLPGLFLQPLRDRLQHAVTGGMAENVIDVHESVETKHQQGDAVRRFFRRGDHRREAGLQRVAVGEPGERVVFGEIADALGLALAHRDVAQDSAILKAIGAVPGREARLDRKRLAIAAASLELHHGAAGREPCRPGRRR